MPIRKKTQRLSQDDSTAKPDESSIKTYDPHDEYDYIIANETFRPKVLITTSVLDNGINIKNGDDKKQCDKVLNIAINAFDKTSFVQMLGRIRQSEGTIINLYLKKYSLDEIKKRTSSLSETLVTILNNDLQDVTAKKKNFQTNLFYYTDEPDTFSTYNPCAVYQLISQISFLLSIIKHRESEFFIKFSNKELEATRNRVTLFYLKNKKNSWQKTWSRSVLDILESAIDKRTRQNYANEDMRVGVIEDRYAVTYEDTFEKYLLTDRLPKLFVTQMDEIYKKFTRVLDESKLNILDTLIRREEETQKSKLSVTDKIKIAQAKFPEEDSNIFLEKVEKLEALVKYYKWWGSTDDVYDLGQMQLKYLNIQAEEEDIDKWIKSHAVSEQRLKEVNPNDETYWDAEFLKQYGIRKGHKYETAILKKYFPDIVSITDILKNKKKLPEIHLSDGSIYTIISKQATGHGHPVYYLMVIKSNNMEKKSDLNK